MPHASVFSREFGLKKGSTINSSLTVIKSSVQHVQVIRYNKYEYPIHLVLSSPTKQSIAQVKSACQKNWLSNHKIIYSQYGNPYDCWISNIKVTQSSSSSNNNQFTYEVTALGTGVRVRVNE